MNTGPWILGISASPHNGAVCLLRGDEIVVAIQEERLTRKKRDGIYAARPCQALEYCFQYAGITPADLSRVVYSIPGARNSRLQDITLNPQLELGRHRTPVDYIPHHYAHAFSVYATSGYQDAAILIVDGAGSPYSDLGAEERAACKWPVEDGAEIISLYAADGTRIKPLEKHLVAAGAWLEHDAEGMLRYGSLGGMYSAIAAQIFGEQLEAGKVMGLAPYGRPTTPAADFFTRDADGRFVFSDKVMRRFRRHGRWPAHQQEYEDLAASTQAALEEAILYLVERLYELCPSENFCYAGGVALNSVANERIVGESAFRNVYIMPAAEDSGPAIGAAYYGLWQLTGQNTGRLLVHDAVGREYSPAEVTHAVENSLGVREIESEDVIADAVNLLSAGHIVGWFQGRSELGPRALGQRSILCDPRRHDGKEVLNRRVKHREGFRPFAPVVLLEEVGNWFEVEGKDPRSPYMLRICDFKEEKKELVPAVVHVDGTGRFQTVTEEANGDLYRLIKKFHEKTGVPIILNTSFNVMGEPIVESPTDALRSFLSTGIDYLVLQGRLFAKTHKVLFEVDGRPWGQRVRDAVAAAKQLATRPPNARPRPSAALQQYAGDFENAGMGLLSLREAEGGLSISTAAGGGKWSSPVRHLDEHVFEVSLDPFKGYRLIFIPDGKGNMDSLVVLPAHASAREVVFMRKPDASVRGRALLERFVGDYGSNGKSLSITLGGDEELVLTVPGQVGIQLVPRTPTEFRLQQIPGYCVEFRDDGDGVVVEAVVTEPEGGNVLKKK
ncbi:MAG: carbamoyltransferase [Acidobacteria bacterium]|nr:carbamoyltransferase [Acidobacteriota bacterium]